MKKAGTDSKTVDKQPPAGKKPGEQPAQSSAADPKK